MSKSASSSSGKHLSSIHCKQNQRLHRRQGYRDRNPSQEFVHTRARQSSHGQGNLGSASGSYFAHPLGTISRNGNRPLCQGCYIRNQLLRTVAPTSFKIATEQSETSLKFGRNTKLTVKKNQITAKSNPDGDFRPSLHYVIHGLNR